MKKAGAAYDVKRVRAQIPQMGMTVHEKPLVYLDNAATTLKPEAVIARLDRFYRQENANVHRGAHWLAEQGTGMFEAARATVADFVGGREVGDVVFTRGTTESINLVAQCFALWGAADARGLREGDEVLLVEFEHHSNIVPWQMACARVGASVKFVPITAEGEIDLRAMRTMLSKKTKVVAFSSCSNVLGTMTDPAEVVAIAKTVGATVLVDAAQMVTAAEMNVGEWGADFVAFSGHKVFAPLGIGVLWAKKPWLDLLPPYQGGGSMIDRVSITETTWADAPNKFEAGTPNVGGAVGLAEALKWFDSVGRAAAMNHAKDLADEARVVLAEIGGVQIYGHAKVRASIVAFNIDGAHASDLGAVLDQQGIAIRAGHHCCQPLLKKLGCAATARASFSIYNTSDDVAAFAKAVRKAKEMLL